MALYAHIYSMGAKNFAELAKNASTVSHTSLCNSMRLSSNFTGKVEYTIFIMNNIVACIWPIKFFGYQSHYRGCSLYKVLVGFELSN